MAKKKYTFKYGGKRGKKINLVESPDMVVIRTKGNKDLEKAKVSRESRELLEATDQVAEFPEAGVSIVKMQGDTIKEAKVQRDLTRASLKKDEEIRFAGRVLQDEKSGEAILYTENFFVKFKDKTEEKRCLELLESFHLEIKDKLFFANNAYFVCVKEGTGLEIFDLAEALLKEKEVEFCHPELVQERRFKVVHPLQWHLAETVINNRTINAHVNIEGAWKYTKGKGITIAVIDDGFEINHPEFQGRIVAPYDAGARSSDVSPKSPDENHGTACAGVACAAGISGGASGTAPEANLMPIRLRAGLGSMAEAQAFGHAAQKGADVISCSWGPPDGRWWDPMDPTHDRRAMLPDSTRLAMDYAMKEGRQGKGCVILFAAGNGNESTENDGYASYPPIITVAACNDQGTRSIYSDFGESVTVAFPSGDFGWKPLGHAAPVAEGIRTTDRFSDAGYDTSDYTNSFSGTSSACPGMAGVVALMLASNPELTPSDVQEIIQKSCVKIDPEHGDYDAVGHSKLYGYGRIQAALAVQNAMKAKTTQADSSAIEASLSQVSIIGYLLFSNRKKMPIQLGKWMQLTGKKLSGLSIGLESADAESSLKAVLQFSKNRQQDNMGSLGYIGLNDGRSSIYGLSLQLNGSIANTHNLIYGVRIKGQSKIDAAQNGDFVGVNRGIGSPIESLIILLKEKK